LRRDVAASEISAALPDIAVNRRADDPLANLRAWLLRTDQRVMLCADSIGRRETLQQYFNEFDLTLALCDSYQDFITADAKVMLGVAPLHDGFALTGDPGGLAFVTETELYAGSGRRAGRRRQ